MATSAAVACLAGLVIPQFAHADVSPPGLGVPTGGLLINAFGQPSDFGGEQELAGVTVDAANGNLLIHEIDDHIADGGPANTSTLNFDRWYNGLATDRRDVGRGWRTGIGYDVSLSGTGSDTVTLTAPSARTVAFNKAADGTYTTAELWTLQTTPSGYEATDIRRPKLGDVAGAYEQLGHWQDQLRIEKQLVRQLKLKVCP